MTQPPNTLRADVEGSGVCYLPDHFADEFRRLAQALDFARVYGATGRLHATTAVELAAAARYARDLADKADACADRARARWRLS